MVRFALQSLSIPPLAGCANFPVDGPPTNQIIKNARATSDKHYDLVKLDYRVTAKVATRPLGPLTTLSGSCSTAQVGLIEDGDVLSVAIFRPNSETSICVAGTSSRWELRDPLGFCSAQRFEVQSDDIIYGPHADRAKTWQFFEDVNELSSVSYDIGVINTTIN